MPNETRRKKRPPGRPLAHGQRAWPVGITLTDDMKEKARWIGRGNVSAGIREALEAYRVGK